MIHSLGDRSMSVRRSVDTFTRVGSSFAERKGVTYDRGKGERDLGWLSEHGGLVSGGGVARSLV